MHYACCSFRCISFTKNILILRVKSIMYFLEYFQRPVRFDYLLEYLPQSDIVVLDVGCGNHSPSLAKRYLRNCVYHGLDLNNEYNNDSNDFASMDHFYKINLDASDLNTISDHCYDCIIFSHVIEHLQNGLEVLERLIRKLKQGGIIYIETPSSRSLKMPRMQGSLNFWDDPTHVKIYPLHELTNTVTEKGCKLLRAGTRRSLKRIILIPVHFLYSLIKYKYVSGTVFWDIVGFANVLIARKM